MSLQRARTAEEYIEWVKQAKFEVADLKECLLFEEETLTRFPPYLEPTNNTTTSQFATSSTQLV